MSDDKEDGLSFALNETRVQQLEELKKLFLADSSEIMMGSLSMQCRQIVDTILKKESMSVSLKNIYYKMLVTKTFSSKMVSNDRLTRWTLTLDLLKKQSKIIIPERKELLQKPGFDNPENRESIFFKEVFKANPGEIDEKDKIELDGLFRGLYGFYWWESTLSDKK